MSTPEGDAPAPSRRSRRRRWIAAVLLLVASVALERRLASDPIPAALERVGPVDLDELQSREVDAGGVVERRQLRVESGLTFELALRVPERPESSAGRAPLPAVLLLGGHETGREAIELVGTPEDAVVCTLSYPLERDPNGPRLKGWRAVAAIPRIRAALRDTTAALLIAAEWLRGREEVDPERIELAGVSLGAPFACIAGALDPGIARVWSIHGSGDPPALLEFALRRKIEADAPRRLASRLVSRLAWAEHLAPERYVARIAPRPFVMINARDDERLPRAGVELLFQAAGEPRELQWRAGEHVDPKREAIVADLLDTVLTRLREDPRRAPLER